LRRTRSGVKIRRPNQNHAHQSMLVDWRLNVSAVFRPRL
jgi:hypothetical protein